MGYYFPKAKTVADLSEEQKGRYEELRAPETELPLALKNRLEVIKERIGPITSGEVWSAFEELWRDAVVCWILANENPDIEWVDLELAKDERTEEELQRDREAWENTVREWREREERERREYDDWEKKEYPVRHYIRKFFSRFRNLT